MRGTVSAETRTIDAVGVAGRERVAELQPALLEHRRAHVRGQLAPALHQWSDAARQSCTLWEGTHVACCTPALVVGRVAGRVRRKAAVEVEVPHARDVPCLLRSECDPRGSRASGNNARRLSAAVVVLGSGSPFSWAGKHPAKCRCGTTPAKRKTAEPHLVGLERRLSKVFEERVPFLDHNLRRLDVVDRGVAHAVPRAPSEQMHARRNPDSNVLRVRGDLRSHPARMRREAVPPSTERRVHLNALEHGANCNQAPS